MDEHVVDLSSLLHEIDRQIADAQRAVEDAHQKHGHAMGMRAGVLRALAEVQRQTRPIATNGVEQPA